ncbi:hypothetical protein JCM11641_000051, partial [Rhodosporidiobolus odoratus]
DTMEHEYTLFDLSTLSAALPSPTLSPPSRTTASLFSLPPEIKIHIAKDVFAAEHGHRSGGIMVDARLTSMNRPTTLACLSLVNKDFYQACEPLLWKEVDLVNHSCESLLVFLQEILPRHADSIHVLSVGQRGEDDLLGFRAPRSRASQAKPREWKDQRRWQTQQDAEKAAREHALLAAAVVQLPEVGTGGAIVQKKHIKDIFLASIMRRVFSLREVKLTALPRTGSLARTVAVLVKVAMLPLLERLELKVNAGLQPSLSSLSALFRPSLHVTTLTLDFDQSVGTAIAREVASGVKQLNSLRSIRLLKIPSDLLSLFVLDSSPITLLDLSLETGCSISYLNSFLAPISATLTKLFLHLTSLSGDSTERLRLHSLTDLTLSSKFSEAYKLTLFSGLPLLHLTLDSLSHHDLPNFLCLLTSLDNTLRTLRYIKPTLVTPADEYDEAKDDMERVWNWCAVHGVRAELPDVEIERMTRIYYDSGDEG